MSTETVEKDKTPEEIAAEKKAAEEEAAREKMRVYSKDGKRLYETNQQELDDVFFNVVALGAWTKTFVVGPYLKLTYSTITNDQKMELLESIKAWSEKAEASPNMFDEKLNVFNLSYYLAHIELKDDLINLNERKPEDRRKFFGSLADPSLTLYGTYLFVFLEIIRLALLDKVALKN